MTTHQIDDELVARILAILPPVEPEPLPGSGFMLLGAEVAYGDIVPLIESAIWTILGNRPSIRQVVIEEYTVIEPRSFLPTASEVCEYLDMVAAESEAGENVEYGGSSVVLSLAEALARRMSDEGSGWMCDALIASHTVTLADLQPMLDGEPWGDPIDLGDPEVRAYVVQRFISNDGRSL